MDFDLLITNGRILDGTGLPEQWGAVGVREETIDYLGPDRSGSARREIDAGGMVVCPGFFDMHAHSDLMLLAEPRASAKLMQGCTTELIGQDGLSYAPLTDQTLAFFRSGLKALNGDPEGLDWTWRSVAEFLDRFDRRTAVNVAMLAPHGNVRAAVMGLENRPASPTELDQMKRLVQQALSEGAFGLSTGLTYPPCSYADTRELTELCRVVARHGGFLAPHLRNYGGQMPEALEEVIGVCRASGCALHLTHFQASFPPNQDKAEYYLERIREARRAGLDLTLDAYPYPEASTFLAGLLPGWTHEGGPERLLQRLRDPQTRQRIRSEMEIAGSDGLHKLPIQWETIVLADLGDAGKDRDLIGLDFAEVSRRRGRTPMDCCAELLVEHNLEVSCIVRCGYEENIQKLMRDPEHMASSDGLLVGARPHPRAWGTFARLLSRYVRQLRVLSLPECVRRMTGLAAQRLGLEDRGLLAVGKKADLVVFDPDTVRETATPENPRSHPEGIPYVIVNGVVVKDAGIQTDALPGRALRSRRTGGR
ncbi:MAG: N-acyl-D-amino-acid deacylase family protein [Thermoguttaceae bacterium]